MLRNIPAEARQFVSYITCSHTKRQEILLVLCTRKHAEFKVYHLKNITLHCYSARETLKLHSFLSKKTKHFIGCLK